MPSLDASTDFADDGGTPGWRAGPAPSAARGQRCSVGGMIFTLIILPPLAAFLAAAAWLFWLLANGALGRQGSCLGLVALVAGAAAFSRHTGLGFAGSLILVGFGGLALLLCALFGVAGYALIFGG